MTKELKFATEKEAVQYLADCLNKQVKIAADYETAVGTSSIEEVEEYFKQAFMAIARENALPEAIKRLRSFLSQNLGLLSDKINEYVNLVKTDKRSPTEFITDNPGNSEVYSGFLQQIGQNLNLSQKTLTSLGDVSKDVADWNAVVRGDAEEQLNKAFAQPFWSIYKNEADFPTFIQTMHYASDKVIDYLLSGKYLKSPHITFSIIPRIMRNKSFDSERNKNFKKPQQEGIKKSQIREVLFDVNKAEDKEALEAAKHKAKSKVKADQDQIIDFMFDILISKFDSNDIFTTEGKLKGRTFLNKYKQELRDLGITEAQQFDKIFRAFNETLDEISAQAKKPTASLKFASIEEALQHLADITGESIQII